MKNAQATYFLVNMQVHHRLPGSRCIGDPDVEAVGLVLS
jgi:hypothetical protein